MPTAEPAPSIAPLELWGGAECTVNRVADRYVDQLRLTGHHDRLEDLDRFAELGVSALRTPVLWERVQTSPDCWDWDWADAYLARLKSLGIRPIVGLVHHGAGPRWATLDSDDFAEGLGAFAAQVARRYPWVTDWTPVNEPLTTARFSCLYGHWYPHERSERAFWSALLTQLEGVRAAMRAIRQVTPVARLIQTEDFGRTYATAPCADQARHENARRLMTWDLLSGRVGPRHPLTAHLATFGLTARLKALVRDPCPADVIGMNYYVTSDRHLDHRLALYPDHLHGGNGVQAYADTEAVRVSRTWRPRWRDYLAFLARRYDRAVAITECHIGCEPDQQIAWVAGAMTAARAAKANGVPVAGLTIWSLAGCVGWDRLLTEQGGSYEPGALDALTPGAPWTPLGDWLRSGETESSSRGWWRRPDRRLYARKL